MSPPTFYRFRSEWELEAPRARVFDVLREGENYERWWPQVKRSARLGDGSYELVARSFLPYALHMVLTESTLDEGAGVLEANLDGDLEGFSRWTLLERGRKTIATFDQEVVTHKPHAEPGRQATVSLQPHRDDAPGRTGTATLSLVVG